MRKINRKGVSPLIVVLIIVIIVVAVLAGIWFWRELQVPTGDQIFYGTVSVTVGEDNWLDRGASVSTTSDSYIMYHSKGKSLDEATEDDFIGGYTFTVGTAKDIPVEDSDLGIMFIKAYTGTDFFLHVEGTLQANTRIGESKFVDVDNDNRLEVVFEVDFSDIASPLPTAKPSYDITMMVVAEDTALALNSPDDQDSIGTGTKTGTIEWQIGSLAEKQGFRLARLYVTSNETTFETLATVTGVEIAGVGTFSGSDIESDSGAKTWYVDIDVDDYRELVYTHLLMREAGGTSYVAVTVSWETYFTAGTDAVNMTLYVQTMGADEAVDTALNDVVMLGG